MEGLRKYQSLPPSLPPVWMQKLVLIDVRFGSRHVAAWHHNMRSAPTLMAPYADGVALSDGFDVDVMTCDRRTDQSAGVHSSLFESVRHRLDILFVCVCVCVCTCVRVCVCVCSRASDAHSTSTCLPPVNHRTQMMPQYAMGTKALPSAGVTGLGIAAGYGVSIDVVSLDAAGSMHLRQISVEGDNGNRSRHLLDRADPNTPVQGSTRFFDPDGDGSGDGGEASRACHRHDLCVLEPLLLELRPSVRVCRHAGCEWVSTRKVTNGRDVLRNRRAHETEPHHQDSNDRDRCDVCSVRRQFFFFFFFVIDCLYLH